MAVAHSYCYERLAHAIEHCIQFQTSYYVMYMYAIHDCSISDLRLE